MERREREYDVERRDREYDRTPVEETATGRDADRLDDGDLAPAEPYEPAGTSASTSDTEPKPALTPDEGVEPDEGLLPRSDAERFRERWEAVQASFLDEPSKSVEEADELVADVMQRVAQGFAQERTRLEGLWSGGKDASTEDLRLTLQRYRSFFQRLLAA